MLTEERSCWTNWCEVGCAALGCQNASEMKHMMYRSRTDLMKGVVRYVILTQPKAIPDMRCESAVHQSLMEATATHPAIRVTRAPAVHWSKVIHRLSRSRVWPATVATMRMRRRLIPARRVIAPRAIVRVAARRPVAACVQVAAAVVVPWRVAWRERRRAARAIVDRRHAVAIVRVQGGLQRAVRRPVGVARWRRPAVARRVAAVEVDVGVGATVVAHVWAATAAAIAAAPPAAVRQDESARHDADTR